MSPELKFEIYDSTKLVKCISKDTNPSQFTDFLKSLDDFRLEVNNFLSNRISANGVSDNTDDDDDSGSDKEEVEAVSPKKRKK